MLALINIYMQGGSKMQCGPCAQRAAVWGSVGHNNDYEEVGTAG